MFVLSILIHGLIDVAFLAAGVLLFYIGHPIAGGWCIAGAIISLLGTSIHTENDDKKEKAAAKTETEEQAIVA